MLGHAPVRIASPAEVTNHAGVASFVAQPYVGANGTCTTPMHIIGKEQPLLQTSGYFGDFRLFRAPGYFGEHGAGEGRTCIAPMHIMPAHRSTRTFQRLILPGCSPSCCRRAYAGRRPGVSV